MVMEKDEGNEALGRDSKSIRRGESWTVTCGRDKLVQRQTNGG
jgi:hypothetical protein